MKVRIWIDGVDGSTVVVYPGDVAGAVEHVTTALTRAMQAGGALRLRDADGDAVIVPADRVIKIDMTTED